MAAPYAQRRSTTHRIRPLVLALASAFPLGLSWGAGPMPVVAPTALPKPHDGSQTLNGRVVPFLPAGQTQSAVTYNYSTTAPRLDVTQTTQRAITQWQSFDVGISASVNFYMPTANSAMLARVVPTGINASTATPSQILGSVRTLYLDATGKEHIGGELFLMNPAGWLFGKNATVDVGGLVASALDIRNTDFMSGLGSIDQTAATFSWQYVNGGDQTAAQAAALYRADGLVQVEAGAQITTASGGRVFLFAPTVANNGTITTPDGQTVLAGGSEVYLNNPQHEKLYASEVNANVPALRGLLVEVSNGPNGETGTATNAGEIISAHGNTTLVAMAVRQAGHISASANSAGGGSVLLTARSDVLSQTSGSDASVLNKHATKGGSLVLTGDSHIDLLADDTSTPTTAGTPFVTSHVYLSGKTIDMQSGSVIKAPGAVVNVRAEATPAYMGGAVPFGFDAKTTFGAAGAAEKDARITLGAKAMIDVSGTTTTQVDGGRYYVTPSLITNSDLKDAPLQKLGPLFHSGHATFDVRQDVPMFSSTQGYRDALSMSVGERLAVGGSVNLHSTGAVVTHADSLINVSGGQVNVSAVGVKPGDPTASITRLQDQAGNIYTLNTAPADRIYTVIAPQKVAEAAYAQGAAAGKLTVTGAQVVMPGKLLASTVSGRRQLAGQDALAARAQVQINTWLSATDRNAASVLGALPKANMEIGQQATSASEAFWQDIQTGSIDKATAELPTGSMLGAALLGSQAGAITVQTDGGLHWLAHNDVTLVPGTTLNLQANGDKGVQVDSSIRDAAGSVSVKAADSYDDAGALLTHTSGLALADGQHIDVSGRFVNQLRDGLAVAPVGTQGGTVALSSDGALRLGSGTVLDVSGGAVLASSGVLKGQDAGTITVASGLGGFNAQDGIVSRISLGGVFYGYAFTKGGSLNLTADTVSIGDHAITTGTGELALTPQALTQNGFGSYALNGIHGLTVADGTALAPVQTNWLATSALGKAATDTALASVSRVADLGAHVRSATHVSLRSSLGGLTVGQGASIVTDEQARLNLQATQYIDMEGHIVDYAGTVTMQLDPRLSSLSNERTDEGVLWLGQNSVVDVSGIAVSLPNSGALRQGKVLAGGTVSLSATEDAQKNGGVVMVSKGAKVNISGAADTFDVVVTDHAGSHAQAVQQASAGGTLSVRGTNGAMVEGQVQAQGGSDTAVAGAFNLNVTGTDYALADATSAALPQTYSIHVQQDAAQLTAGKTFSDRLSLVQNKAVWGSATVSSNWLNQAGFADVTMVTGDRIDATQSATISAMRNLTLSAQALQVAPDQSLSLSAPHVSLGSALRASADSGQSFDPTSTGGTGTLNVGALHVDLNGSFNLQGLKAFNIHGLGGATTAAQAIELRGAGAGVGVQGQLNAASDMNIKAVQVFPDTAESYTINDLGHTVQFAQGDATAAKPMSAGGQLTVNAQHILQGGVLRAPFGRITLNADTIDVQAGSETSVSGAGLLVPFGSTINGTQWVYQNASDTQNALLGKQINFNTSTSDKGILTVSGAALIDERGGGDVYAREFIAGPGGSKDIFAGAAGGAFAVVPLAFANQSGFAVSDRAILAATDAAGQTASISPGQQITFGANGVLPAGTYVVLPAAYASMAGAYLIKPDTASARAGAVDMTAPTYQLADGSASVAAKLSYAGTRYQDTFASRYIVMSRAVANTYSQVNLTSGNAFFANQAIKNQVALPPLPQDGGTLTVLSPTVTGLTQGVIQLAGDATQSGARGGQFELGVNKLHVGDVSSGDASVTELSASVLNAMGAQTVILGGTLGNVQASGERLLAITASDIAVDASRKTGSIQAGDITLLARQTIKLNDGVVIEAMGAGSSEAYHVSGDGTSVRVSGRADASLTRSDTSLVAGELSMGAGTTLKSATGRVLIDGAHRVTLDATVHLMANALLIGAPRLVMGHTADAPDALHMSDTLLAQIGQAQDLTLRSFSSVDFYQTADKNPLMVGSAALQKLTLDAGTLQGHDGVSVNVQAGDVWLVNSSGALSSSSSSSSDTGRLNIVAQGVQGDIHVVTGVTNARGSSASTQVVSGFQSTQLNAQRSVVMAGHGGGTLLGEPDVQGPGGLTVVGDVAFNALSLTASSGSNTALVATGQVAIASPSNNTQGVAPSGLGAHLSIQGNTISQGGLIDLRSGGLSMQATGASASGTPAVNLLDGSRTVVSGTTANIGGQSVDTFGGYANLVATAGDVRIAQGATVEVSAGGRADAGRLNLKATSGRVDLQGRLLGTSQSGALGGSLSVDANTGLNLDALSNHIQTGSAPGLLNFGQQVAVRSRSGEGLSLSKGQQISAENVSLVSDQGAVTIAGGLHADAANGGQLLVAAGRDLTLDGAALSAKALVVSANTPVSAGRIDLQSSAGTIKVVNHTQIDLSTVGVNAAGGVLAMRALRTADGKGVKINALNATVTGARAIQLEGVKVWDKAVNPTTGVASTSDIATLSATGTAKGVLGLNTVLADALAYTANSAAVNASVSAGNATLASLIEVRPGEEVRTPGTLTLNQDWNLSAVDATGARLAGAAPVNLTLRAGGDLALQASVSDGFRTALPTGIVQAGSAGDIRVVAGADTTSANVMATQAGVGDVLMGTSGSSKTVLLRTTTGSIQVAAGHDINMLSSGAAVYTTGHQVSAGASAGFSNMPNVRIGRTPVSTNLTSVTATNPSVGTAYAPLKAGATVVDPFYTGGGNIALQAQHDVLGLPADTDAAITPANWLYTNDQPSVQQTSWWARYDKFSQGVATLGGGNVSVQAGHSVQDLQVAAAGGGFQQSGTGVAKNFGAGTVSVLAGQDILATNATNTGDGITLTAGNRIAATERGSSSQSSALLGSAVLSFNGDNHVSALGDIMLATAANAVRTSQFLVVLTGNTITSDALSNVYAATNLLGAHSSLAMQSAGGDVTVGSPVESELLSKVFVSADGLDSPADLTAVNLVVSTPSGSINLAAPQTQLFTTDGGQFKLVADQSVAVNRLVQRGAAAGGSNDTTSINPLGLDSASVRDPIVLVAGQGHVTLAGSENTLVVRPMQVFAGQDILIQNSLTIQHQAAADLSLFQAGRDIQLWSPNGSRPPSITVRGPGDLMLVSGRDTNLGVREGIVANGNSANSALPAKSAQVSVLAGVKLDAMGATLASAEGRFPQLLGGMAYLTGMPADVELAAVKSALALVGAGAAFDASLSNAKAAFVSTLGAGFSGLSAEQRLAAFDGFKPDVQAQFIKDYLSAHVLGDASVATAASPQDVNLGSLAQKALLALPVAERSTLATQLASALSSPYQAQLLDYMAQQTGHTNLTATQATDAFAALPVARQVLFTEQVAFNELRLAGRSAVNAGSEVQKAADYQRGYDALSTLFPAQHAQVSGDILMPLTQLKTYQSSPINLLAPVGNVNGGLTSVPSNDNRDASAFGVVALGGGAVNAVLGGNYLVNTSRVFTLGGGDLLMWSSNGNIDAGKGARTVQGAPAPVFYIDSSGALQVDTTAAIAGSGIASGHDLDVYAPHGIVDSGDAGLRSAGAASLGGARVVCLGCAFGGPVVGLPAAAPAVAPPAPAAALPTDTKAGPAPSESDDEKKKKKKKHQIQLDFLGFGVASADTKD